MRKNVKIWDNCDESGWILMNLLCVLEFLLSCFDVKDREHERQQWGISRFLPCFVLKIESQWVHAYRRRLALFIGEPSPLSRNCEGVAWRGSCFCWLTFEREEEESGSIESSPWGALRELHSAALSSRWKSLMMNSRSNFDATRIIAERWIAAADWIENRRRDVNACQILVED